MNFHNEIGKYKLFNLGKMLIDRKVDLNINEKPISKLGLFELYKDEKIYSQNYIVKVEDLQENMLRQLNQDVFKSENQNETMQKLITFVNQEDKSSQNNAVTLEQTKKFLTQLKKVEEIIYSKIQIEDDKIKRNKNVRPSFLKFFNVQQQQKKVIQLQYNQDKKDYDKQNLRNIQLKQKLQDNIKIQQDKNTVDEILQDYRKRNETNQVVSISDQTLKTMIQKKKSMNKKDNQTIDTFLKRINYNFTSQRQLNCINDNKNNQSTQNTTLKKSIRIKSFYN